MALLAKLLHGQVPVRWLDRGERSATHSSLRVVRTSQTGYKLRYQRYTL